MIAIACVDLKNGIGKDGNLLISIPEDQKFFRETTRDSVVVMGRKTLFSFKNKEPLKNRINIVFTSNVQLKEEYKNFDNIYFVQSELDFDNILKKYNDKKVFLIGGEKIYFDLIDKCDTALITKVYKEFEADTFFPDLTERGFKVEKESELFTYNEINYKFITYKK
ncbi:MAG: dihydrofolate reductase [Lachnospiraceae bacterium]|nr:dihydrofolate reductase [Lachnospiraceae bacterium]